MLCKHSMCDLHIPGGTAQRKINERKSGISDRARNQNFKQIKQNKIYVYK